MCQVCPRIQQPKWKRHHFQFSQLKLTLRAALAQPSAPKSISSLLPSPRRQQHNFFVSMFLLGAPEQEMVQHVQVLVQELQALFFFELFFALLFSLFFSAVMLSFLLSPVRKNGFHSADQGAMQEIPASSTSACALACCRSSI